MSDIVVHTYRCRSFRKLWSDGDGESRPRKVRLFVRPLWNEFAWKCGNVRTYVNSAVAYWQREPANFDLVIEQTESLSNLRLTHSFQLSRRRRRRHHIPMCACDRFVHDNSIANEHCGRFDACNVQPRKTDCEFGICVCFCSHCK